MRAGFDPWSRKTARATEQPSPWATTVAPVGPRPLSSATRDTTAVRSLCSAAGEQPLPTARGRPRPAAKTSAVQIKIKKQNSALPMQAVCVRSLVGELRLHKPHSGAKNQRETGLNRAWTLATAGLTACRPPPSSSRGRGQGQSSPVALPALRPHSVRAPCAGSPTRLPVCTRPGSLHGGVCNYSSDGSNEPKLESSFLSKPCGPGQVTWPLDFCVLVCKTA